MAAKKKVSKKATKRVVKKVAAKAKPVAKKKVAAKKTTSKVAKKAKKKPANKSTSKAKRGTKANNRFEQLQQLLQDNLAGLNTDKAEALSKNIWLAGLGAYSKTFDELSERYDNLQDRRESINAEGQKVFEELIDQGKSMQVEFEKALQQGRSSLEQRVEEFKQRFGGGLSSFVDIPGRLRDAAERIEAISDKLQKK